MANRISVITFAINIEFYRRSPPFFFSFVPLFFLFFHCYLFDLINAAKVVYFITGISFLFFFVQDNGKIDIRRVIVIRVLQTFGRRIFRKVRYKGLASRFNNEFLQGAIKIPFLRSTDSSFFLFPVFLTVRT